MFESGAVPKGWRLGDSGYPLRPCLLTLVISPTRGKINASQFKKRYTVDKVLLFLKLDLDALMPAEGPLFIPHQGLAE